MGEACNVVKKLERERHGWRGSRATLDDLAQELADVVICADLCAVTAGIDLDAAVVAKFNATSRKQGLSTLLPEAPAAAASIPGAGGLPDQVAAQCRVVSHLARALARVHDDYALLASAGAFASIMNDVDSDQRIDGTAWQCAQQHGCGVSRG